MPKYDDLNELHKLFSNPSLNLFNPDGPHIDIEESRKYLEYWIYYDWEEQDLGYYILETKEDLEFIGHTGLAMRNLSGKNILNLAYRIEEAFQGRGLVKEACEKVFEEYEKFYDKFPILIHTKRQNAPSIGVAKSLGFNYNKNFDNNPDKDDISFFNISNAESDRYL